MKHFYCIITFLILFSCSSKKNSNIHLRGNALGTTYNIQYKDAKKRDFTTSINHIIDQVNNSISTYKKDSDISKINNGDSSIKVDSIFEEVFLKSRRIYQETNGFFDPTIGILVNAWGFGPDKKNIDSINVTQLLPLVGFNKIKLLTNKTIQKEKQEIFIDFNAIGKGYLIDLIGRMLEKKNVKNYLVEIGGEIRAKGVNEEEKDWNIGILNPNPTTDKPYQKSIRLSNKSMATSGNYLKYKTTKDGKKFVHTVNPKTGMAIESNLISVSVISKLDCADVDAYATAFMAMGLEKTLNFLEKHPELDVVLIYADTKSSKMKTYTTLKE